MSTPSTKRPWFQFHLSTAIVLMFAASGLLWANMRPARFELLESVEPQVFFVEVHWSGWPLAPQGIYALSNLATFGEKTQPIESTRAWISEQPWSNFGDGTQIPKNALICIAILIATAFLTERLQRPTRSDAR